MAPGEPKAIHSHRRTPSDAIARDHGSWQVSWLAGQGLGPAFPGPRGPSGL